MKKALLLSALALVGAAALTAPAAAEDKIGFIYVGPAADAGYNTSMDDGRKYVEKNVGTYWADSDAGMYLAGVAAAHVTKTGKLGFQGGFQIPQLMRSVNAFTLGAQSVNPKAVTTVVWNGGWWEPQKETEATNAFADAGIDVIAEQVDSPITIAGVAEKRGIYIIGKDVDIHDRAPKAWLTGVSWNWGPMMVEEIKQIKAGTWKASNMRGDLASGNVVLDPFGAAVPAAAQADILKLKEAINAGTKSIWEGPIAKQDGTVVVAAGQKLSMEQVETMDYLVKGITGATK